MTLPTDPDEYTERRCPLPVLRQCYLEEPDAYETRVEVCAEPLQVHGETWGEVYPAGEPGPEYDAWEVRCHGGHVLVTPDDPDGNGAAPFDWPLVQQALALVEKVAEPDEDDERLRDSRRQAREGKWVWLDAEDQGAAERVAEPDEVGVSS